MEPQSTDHHSYSDHIARPARNPRWHLLYFVLAAFDLVTVSLSLALSHGLMKIHADSVALNREWNNRLGAYSELGELASATNAPGNDVFDSHDVAKESALVRSRLKEFDSQLAAARRELEKNVPAAVARPMLANLDSIRVAMDDMIQEAQQIFSHFELGEEAKAGARMATMDRKYALVTNAIANMGKQVRAVQDENFASQTAEARSLRKFEYIIAGLIVMMVGCVTIYGHKLSQRVKATDAALAKSAASLQEAASLAAASHAKDEFLANMSHEIRTPLTAILGYCDILREDGIIEQSPPRRIQTIDTIRRAGEHLLRVINDILDLSKIEAGSLQTERIETPLPRILVEVDSLMRPLVSSKGVALRTLLGTPIPDRIVSDPTRLRQILMNLVGNAAKFTDQGAVEVRVAVRGSSGTNQLRVEVEDTGPGMTREQAASLFRPFTQADASVTRKHGGTGLGLTISRRLAQMMGGDVRIANTEQGKGSCFVLELPLSEAPNSSLVHDLGACVEEKIESSQAKSVTLSGRILLAEDGEDNQRLVSFHLRKAGAQVEIAENGQIALEMLRAAEARGLPFDLLLTDMQMPVMDGYTLAATLSLNGSRIPIVALTAHAMADDRQKCLEAGCNDYATKPINKAALLATCRQWIEHGKSDIAQAESGTASAERDTSSQPGSQEVLISELADDPDLAELVDEFMHNLGAKVWQLNEYLSSHRLQELTRLAHQIKGAAGGYGFPTISAAAQRVEQSSKSEEDLEEIRLAVGELTKLCRQAIAGRTQQRANLPGDVILEEVR